MHSRISILTAILFATIVPLSVQLRSSAQILPAITNERDRTLVHSLVKTTLVALNQANLTGNYTVLRDLGTPAFQQERTATQLGEDFQNIRQLNLDFAAIVEYDPEFTHPPIISEQGQMQLKGFFPVSSALYIHFDLVFESNDGQWLMSSIAMRFRPEAKGL